MLGRDPPLRAVDAELAVARCGLASPAGPSRSRAGAERVLLGVETVLHVCAPVAEDAQARSGLRGREAHPEVRADAGGVGEGDEAVVVDLGARAAAVELGVHRGDGTEELERLVDEMAAEVEENAGGGARRGARLPAGAEWWVAGVEARLAA